MEAKHSKFCHLCGKKLLGTYFTYNDTLVVCSECNATTPRCGKCDIPSLQLTLVRGVLICPACRKKLPICPCCHIPILGKYFIIGDSPLPYCEACVNTRPRCDICRVPLDEKGKVFPRQGGNINRCATCLASSVMLTADAELYYRSTNALMKDELQLDIPVLPKLYLAERADLVKLNRQAGILEDPNVPLGPEHQHILGFFQRINEERNIYIERLLPQTLFRAVAAHELAHAWQSFYAPPTQPLMIVEGFAEWVAYSVLLARGQQREAARLTRRTAGDIYGDGLQYFIKLEREQGRQAVLQRART